VVIDILPQILLKLKENFSGESMS